MNLFKQFIVFLIHGILIAIFELIDTAFSNNINIDTIVVMSSYMLITWITYCIYSLGTYGYRVVMKNAKLCIMVNLVVSIILGITLIVSSKYIVMIYGLTTYQKEILKSAIIVHAAGLPFRAVGEFLSDYSKMNCLNKLLYICDGIFYLQMIITNSIVLYYGPSLKNLLTATNICWIVYCLIMFYFSRLYKEKCEYKISSLVEILKHGGILVANNILGKVATTIFVMFASRLNTIQYAIHSIGYEIGTNTEYFSHSVYDFQILMLSKIKNKTCKYKKEQIRMWMKKIYPVVIIVTYIFAIFMTIVIKGEVEFKQCIPFVLIYSVQIISLIYYESNRAFLTQTGNTKYIIISGIIGIFIRIPITLISYYTQIGILGFALASFIDFGIRGIALNMCIDKFVLNDNRKFNFKK